MKRALHYLKLLSLHSRITLFVGFILLLFFASIFYITQKFETRMIASQIKRQANFLGDQVVTLALEPLLNSDEISLNQNINSIVSHKDLAYLAIIGPDGHLYTFIKNTSKADSIGSRKSLLKKHPVYLRHPQNLLQKINGNLIEIVRPIRTDNHLWAIAYLGLSLHTIHLEVLRIRWIALSLGLVLLIVAIFLVQNFTRKIMSPIDDIVKGTEAVSEGNFNFQIPVGDQGELGHLARKFNEMILQLNYYYKQKELLNKKLHDYSEVLEEKIQDRTHQLRKIKEEVVQILHQIPVGLLVVGNDLTIRWHNEEMLKILQIEQTSAKGGAHLLKGGYIKNSQLGEKMLEIFRCGERSVVHFEMTNAGATSQILEIYSQPLFLEDEGGSGMIFIIKDITRETDIEKKMNRVQRLESMGILAGGIAHDFNNALAIILPNAQMLKIQLEGRPEYIRYLETIERATEQAARLTNQILSFARGSKHGKKEVLNLNTQVEEFVNMFRRVVNRKIQIETDLDNNLWNVMADRSQIDQVLMNLSVNARDAMPEGGRLTFSTTNFEADEMSAAFYPNLEPGRYVRLNISDSGSGIPQHFIDKIFDPFFTSKKEGKGTGLGLSMVYGIIKGFNGVIDVHSELQKGTTFTIFLPANFSSVGKKEESELNFQLEHGKILLVDDEELLQDTLTHMLESLNFDVVTAENGQEAVNKFESTGSQFDLIIMDLQMPVMDGFEAAARIWEIEPHARIIFSSGYADPAKIDDLREKGVKHFLKKPYKLKDLVDIMQRVLKENN